MLTAGRHRRFDRNVTTFDIVDTPTAPTPGRGTAVRTPEGYLIVDAYLARDGLLRYSDGRTSWLELRLRTELEQAAASFGGVPVTDEHPPDMLTSENAAGFTLGVVLDDPRVEVVDGVGYLRARIKIFDAGLIAKIDAGQRELSIGFWSDVVIEVGNFEGRRYVAKQTEIFGNHAASVPRGRGRAGPRVRVLMDMAGAAVHASGETPMWTVNVPATLIAALTAAARKKTDQAGMPVTMSKLVGPDGTELEVPTWLAALVEQGMETQQGAAAPAPPPPEAPAAPEAPAPPPAPEEGDQFGEGGEMPEEEDQLPPPLSRDAATALVRARARLERLASKAGIPERADSADTVTLDADDTALARALVAKVLPRAKVDALEAPALDALVDLAADELAAQAVIPAGPINPFEVRVPARKDAEDDPCDLAQIELLRKQGVEI